MANFYDTIPEPFRGFLLAGQTGQVRATSAESAAAPADTYFGDLMFLATILAMCDDHDS